MKCIIIAAVSADGFLSSNNNSTAADSSWLSVEDQQLLHTKLAEHRLHVMGRTTYAVHTPKPDPTVLRVVMTRSPARYLQVQVAEQLEFFSGSVDSFIAAYSSNHETCLVLGGAEIYRQFLVNSAVDEAFITIEPAILSSGVAFKEALSDMSTFNLTMVSERIVNKNGTIIRHFTRTPASC